jgi:hypothetical protein
MSGGDQPPQAAVAVHRKTLHALCQVQALVSWRLAKALKMKPFDTYGRNPHIDAA